MDDKEIDVILLPEEDEELEDIPLSDTNFPLEQKSSILKKPPAQGSNFQLSKAHPSIRLTPSQHFIPQPEKLEAVSSVESNSNLLPSDHSFSKKRISIQPQEEKESVAGSRHSAKLSPRGSHKEKTPKTRYGSSLLQLQYLVHQGKEIEDGLFFKLSNIKFTILSLISNLILLYLTVRISDTSNLFVTPLGGRYFGQGVVVLFWLFVSYIWTIKALDEGVSILVGYLMTRKRGYSIAVFGYCHSNIFGKISFLSKISGRNKMRKIFSRITYIYTFQLLAGLLVTFIPPFIEYHKHHLDYEDGVHCLTYHDRSAIFDRGTPTLNTQFGVAEVLFGKSIGKLRSEEPVDKTLFIMPPQMLDFTKEVHTLTGPGLSAQVYSKCNCQTRKTVEDFTRLGWDAQRSPELIQLSKADGGINMLNYIKESNNTIILSTILSGTHSCGGNSMLDPIPIACKTVIDTFNTVVVGISEIPDSGIAQFTPGFTENCIVKRAANITALKESMAILLGGDYSFNDLPSSYPSALNSLLWWTTLNTKSTIPTFVDAGIETVVSIILRAAIQRSFPVKGLNCEAEHYSELELDIVFTPTGRTLASLFVSFQLFVNFVSLMLAMIWFYTNDLIFPAILIARKQMCFTVMLTSNPKFAGVFSTKMNLHDMWVTYDRIGRVGESKETSPNPDSGIILLDNPKEVRPLRRNKLYNL
ncbi:hypothetical protein BC833DRAFT_309253 [Globomyces pollinis-pini]|nr:hypothetical protein BC833DRAFT_309253 [Globomyces pollinis-pini]